MFRDMEHAVLLITFNRPQYVKSVLESLKESDIHKLYVFKDGPRPYNSEDEKASLEIERLISEIDWDCSVYTNYMQNNLGCGYGPYSAISWAFQYEENLIILEDDCVPTRSFFDFTNSMLEKYKDNNNVRLITGRSQMNDHPIFEKYDYIFSQYAPTLGWATWKRVWKNFDMQMRSVEKFFKEGGFKTEFSSEVEAEFFNKRFKKDSRDSKITFHVWDNMFGYHGRALGGLGIVPSKNLIKYIGFEGTHPSKADSELYTINSVEDYSFAKCPSDIKINQDYDWQYFNTYINTSISLTCRIINKIKRIIKK